MKTNLLKAIPAILVACLFLGAFMTPALASNSIQSKVETGDTSTLRITVTPSTQDVACVPDGVAHAVMTVTLWDSFGLSHITKGGANGPDGLYVTPAATAANVTISAPTVVDSKTENFTATLNLPYTQPAGSNDICFRAAADLGDSATFTHANVNFIGSLGFTIDNGPVNDYGTMVYSQTSAQMPVALHNSANTALKLTGDTPAFTSSTNGDPMVASALKWNDGGGPVSMGTGVTMHASLAAGAPLSANMWVQTPAYGSFNMAGNYTTMTTVTGSSAA